jgi:hypothetical protein
MNRKFKNSARSLKPRNGLVVKATPFMLPVSVIVKIGLIRLIGENLTVNPKFRKVAEALKLVMLLEFGN